ncbi:N-acetyltransferase [Streptomyces lunaelactis]|uniref:N-acetyltransferase n=1 Tax=Streptomyces lunaelactis TaxID=1535768 RepID=A0A2R4T307_9ACTN|nr:GNAT family N-acetyltransferase [Streptomyces lunaelactis]AVZ73486.1 N-acetyltransferase [Streptomyces lunaelactis]NUK04972.1 GNAT family N-acetyltransferase [Streptomyces lunaelactis]NUK17741.1 GNAT family N-acetyltransferase [Streptomyces lunaelactis]NUK26714.1 GNAT family N-acetyltransferase [Streptomyces lunaelactis]NUK58801.1 GNAT family N-acetyltransferase [Streptomyces lunaelactis]
MFRMETEVDKDRRMLLGERLENSNMERSPAKGKLRGTPHGDEVPLEIWAFADGSPDLAGGLTALTWGRWLHVDLLWVADTHRGSGLGTRLLAEAERVAREERGCGWARLETWDFQAPEFYRGRGYEVVGTVEEYPPGATEFILTKRLGS